MTALSKQDSEKDVYSCAMTDTGSAGMRHKKRAPVRCAGGRMNNCECHKTQVPPTSVSGPGRLHIQRGDGIIRTDEI